MSFLAPLFLLGALAVAGPVLFHLIRRTTRDRVPFSSLMFLQPTPPRLTKRSRIEHWLLLLLRALVLGLLALAFARPFLKSPAAQPPATGNGGRTAIVMDTSASLRRAGLWEAAQEKAREAIREAAGTQDVALFAFDRTTHTVLGFDEWRALDPAGREAEARSRVDALQPTWFGTDLTSALTTVAEALVEGDTDAGGAPRRLVLISDLQEGGRLDAIQSYDWPKGVVVALAPVAPATPGNAGLQLAAGKTESTAAAEAGVRVRVSNAADSRSETFQVGWADATGTAFSGAAVDAYVPPGQSRLVTVPWPAGRAEAGVLRLAGDTEDFDNRVATAPPPETRLTVLHFGQDGADDPRQPLFFLRRAMPRTPRLTVEVTAVPPAGPVPADALAKSRFLVVTGPVDPAVATAIRERLEKGATALVALNGPEMADTLSALAGVGSSTLEDVTPTTYAMFGEIDFRHPVFAPFADPRFSDFTKIRFQKYRRLDPATLAVFRVPARFDSGDPALLETDAERGRGGETDAERGRLVVLTSGWVAADSQLAVSSKFPALLASLLDWSGATALAPTAFVAGDAIPRLALGAPDGVAVSVQTPGGTTQTLTAEAAAFSGTDEPGLYQATVGETTRQIPVTLEPAESRTAPLTADDMEKLGVPLAQSADRAQAAAARAALPPAAVAESRQKLWRWFLLAALGVLLLETVLAGRAARRATTPAEAAS
jgi:hypothetical protein